MDRLLSSKKARYVCFLGLSFIYLLPFFNFSTGQFAFYAGDDFSFHLYRVLNVANDIKAAGWPSYLSEFGVHQIMYGLNFFYPWGTTILPLALLYLLCHSLIQSFYVYLFFLNFITLLLAYQAAAAVLSNGAADRIKESVGETAAVRRFAMIYSILYTFSAYRLVGFFVRFSLGEAVALTFLPLIFAGFYSIWFQDGKNRRWLAIGLSLLAYTHVLSAFLTLLVLAFLAVIYLKQSSLKRLGQVAASAGLTLLLSAVSLLPMLEQLATFKIVSVHEYSLQENAKSLWLMLKEGLNSQLNQYSFGFAAAVLLLLGLILLLVNKQRFFDKPVIRHSFYLALGTLVCASQLMPWQLLQETPLKNMQFQFRLFAYLTLFVFMFGAYFLRDKNWAWLVLLLLFAVNYGTVKLAGEQRQQSGDYAGEYLFYSDEEIVASTRYNVYNNTDYFPKAAMTYQQDNGLSVFDKIMLINGESSRLDYQFVGGQTTVDLDLTAAATVDLPFLYYKGIQVTEAGQSFDHQVSDRGTLLLNLPAGSYQLSISYQPTVLMLLAWLISGSALLYLLGSFIISRRCSGADQA